MGNLQLTRPLAVIDLETTGLDTKTARIVEIAVIKYSETGETERRVRRLNPGISIPAEATEVHKITNEMVANEPTFRQIANGLKEFLTGCDLCGFNFSNYDLPILVNEFKRVGIDFDFTQMAVVDVKAIYHKLHPRDLQTAVQEYCGKELEGVHSAEADAEATLEVLQAMVTQHGELSGDAITLAAFGNSSNKLDVQGWFQNTPNGVSFSRGQYTGVLLDVVVKKDRRYLEWMLKQNYLRDTRQIVESALAS